ncbi:MAG: acetyltransferase [bacterium]|jgi:sugar O-acyltransferase (sialic acid O-acetyltransferase NeuD family)
MIIAGAKGFAKELLEIVYRDYRYKEISFYDDVSPKLPDKLFGRFLILKTKVELSNALKHSAYFALGVGVPKVRYQLDKLFKDNGGIIKTIISNKATVGSFDTEISDGCTIMDGVMVSNNVKIGYGCLINVNTIIAHDSVLGAYADIAPNVTISGSCMIGDYVSIGTGAILLPGVKIGTNVIIGAGAVIKNSIPDNSLVIGSPGKVIKKLNEISFK